MSHPNRPTLSTVWFWRCWRSPSPAAPPTAPQQPAAPQPATVPLLPPAFPPQDIVGRWGLAAYHKDEDRARIEAAAANQCKQPYVITLGPTGGVMMHLADQAKPEELRLKGAPGGKTYIGPEGDPPGSAQDREVVSFDGRMLILRWMDPEVQGRYGTMVYVRCGAGRRQAPGQAEGQAKTETQAENGAKAGSAADPERAAASLPVMVRLRLCPQAGESEAAAGERFDSHR